MAASSIKVSKGVVLATAAASITFGTVAAAILLGLGNKRNTQVLKCSTDKDIEYIIKNGPEYIIANPSSDWRRNSFLVSSEVKTIPKNWLFLGIPVRTATNNGFQLQATESKSYIREVSFSAGENRLLVTYGSKDAKPWSTVCKPTDDLDRVQKASNNVPVEYLLSRSNGIPFLNPSLGQKEFNLGLYNAIKSKKNSTYAVYQLLSGLPQNHLTGNESLVMKEARDELVKANSSEVQVWEFGGSYRYYWQPQFPNEQQEAKINAGNWCRGQQYSSPADFTSKGFKVITSSPEVRSSNGWIRQEYPDGRFSGYVNYRAECDGTFYSLKKEGSVDSENENSISYYD